MKFLCAQQLQTHYEDRCHIAGVSISASNYPVEAALYSHFLLSSLLYPSATRSPDEDDILRVTL